MKIILTIVFFACLQVLGHAQVYNAELEGKYLPAKMKLTDGVVYEVIMKYQQPEYFKNTTNKFMISKGSESAAYEQTGGIEAFTINGEIWAQRSIPAAMAYRSNAQKNVSKDFKAVVFVKLKRQGLIEQFEYVVNGEQNNKPNEKFVIIGARTKLMTHNTLKNEMVEGEPSLEKLKEWIADSPEAVEDLRLAEAAASAATSSAGGSTTPADQPAKKGLMGAIEKQAANDAQSKNVTASSVDIGRIINNYNVGYEQRNPGKISYYWAPNMYYINLPAKAKSQAELKAEKQAAIDKVYANRSSTVSSEMTSAKDNVPVKKETFDAKIKRIKADGNKIGVRLIVMPARTVQLQSGTMQMAATPQLEGEYLDESLKAAGQQFVDELNIAFNTTDFELIDMDAIPYRVVKILGSPTRMDDWWATKYKVVFAYTLEPRLEPGSQNADGKAEWLGAVNMLQSLIVTEYIGASSSTKQDILTQILNMGGFRTPNYTHDVEIKDPKEMYEKSVEKLGMPMLDKVKETRAEGIAKVAKKLGP